MAEFGNYDKFSMPDDLPEVSAGPSNKEADLDSDLDLDGEMGPDEGEGFTEEQYDMAKQFINSLGSAEKAMELLSKCEECTDCLDIVDPATAETDKEGDLMNQIVRSLPRTSSSPVDALLYNPEGMGYSDGMG